MTRRRTWKSVRTDESGAIAVEFALVTPVFLILMIGTLVWGQYFWVAHTVQQLANDSARAALAGLDATERESLARSAVTAEIVDYGALRPEAAVVTVENRTDRLTVSVRYDTADAAFRVFEGLVPSPPRTVLRQASVRLGGY